MKYKRSKILRGLLLTCMCVVFLYAINTFAKTPRILNTDTIISLITIYNNFNSVLKIHANNEKFMQSFPEKKLDFLNEKYKILQKKYKELTKNEYINRVGKDNSQNHEYSYVITDEITNIYIRTANNIYDSFLLIYNLYLSNDSNEQVDLPNLKKAYMLAKQIIKKKDSNNIKINDTSDNDE